MLRSWKLGRLFGVGVYVHPTFFLVFLWVVFNSRDAGLTTILTMMALVAAVFGCVLMHEFGHALTARAYGIPTRDITLYPIGGVARLEGVIRRPADEIFIALAGPAVNLAVALVLAVVLAALGVGRVTLLGEDAAPPGASFVFHLLVSNLMLVVFNMVPAFPMDGGRVLRGLLSLVIDRVRATEVAAAVGLVFAAGIALFAVGIVFLGAQFNPFLMFIGLFIAVVGQLELAMVRRAEAARRWAAIPEALPVEEIIPEALPVAE